MLFCYRKKRTGSAIRHFSQPFLPLLTSLSLLAPITEDSAQGVKKEMLSILADQ
jgi:hypothetical protein